MLKLLRICYIKPMIKEITNKLIKNEEINFIELREVFDEIFSGLADEIQTTSFITALSSSNLSDEALLASLASSEDIVKFPINFDKESAIQNIFLTNQENIIDIQLAIDIICCANNLNISRYSISNQDNYIFKNAKALGINLNKEIDYNCIDFEKLNFNYFYLSNENPYFKYSQKIENKLSFENILNTTTRLLNPLSIKNLFLGVNDKNLVEKYANIALKLNKSNSIILAGDNNTPFISPNGETYIAEAWKNKIFTYILTPDLLGFKENSLDELKISSKEENASALVEIFENKLKNPKCDSIILNSALSLYISKKADSIISGIELAKKTIETGLALEKLNQIKKFYE